MSDNLGKNRHTLKIFNTYFVPMATGGGSYSFNQTHKNK